MTSPLDKLLEAVGVLANTAKAAHVPYFEDRHGILTACSMVDEAAAEVRKARGEAHHYHCRKCGDCLAHPQVDHVMRPADGECATDRCEGDFIPLYSVPPDTVPREKVERLVRAAWHASDACNMKCECGLDAALRDLGMEGR